MDFFIQALLRNALASIEGDNSDNDSDSDESVDSTDDNDSDCWQLPVPDDDDRHLSVTIVSDNAKVLAVARPEVFRRIEDIKKQKDQWDANHGTHSNSNNINTNRDDLKREMRDSMLSVASTCRKQQQHRDFRREMSDSMLVVQKRRCSDMTKVRNFRRDMSESMLVLPKRISSDKSEELTIIDEEKKEDEGHGNGNGTDKYKQSDFRRGMSGSMLVVPKRISSDSSEELTVIDEEKKEDEGHGNGNDTDKYKLKGCMVTTNKLGIQKYNTPINRDAKSNYYDRRKNSIRW